MQRNGAKRLKERMEETFFFFLGIETGEWRSCCFGEGGACWIWETKNRGKGGRRKGGEGEDERKGKVLGEWDGDGRLGGRGREGGFVRDFCEWNRAVDEYFAFLSFYGRSDMSTDHWKRGWRRSGEPGGEYVAERRDVRKRRRERNGAGDCVGWRRVKRGFG